jgi:hypothetical protein
VTHAGALDPDLVQRVTADADELARLRSSLAASRSPSPSPALASRQWSEGALAAQPESAVGCKGAVHSGAPGGAEGGSAQHQDAAARAARSAQGDAARMQCGSASAGRSLQGGMRVSASLSQSLQQGKRENPLYAHEDD